MGTYSCGDYYQIMTEMHRADMSRIEKEIVESIMKSAIGLDAIKENNNRKCFENMHSGRINYVMLGE